MKTPLRSFCYFALAFVAASLANAAHTHGPNATALTILDRQFAALATEGEIVGGQVAVRRGNEPIFSKGYGSVASGSKRGVDETTLFLIGSCSKPFASIVILNLIDDDNVAIKLDDTIDHWNGVRTGSVPRKRTFVLAVTALRADPAPWPEN